MKSRINIELLALTTLTVAGSIFLGNGRNYDALARSLQASPIPGPEIPLDPPKRGPLPEPGDPDPIYRLDGTTVEYNGELPQPFAQDTEPAQPAPAPESGGSNRRLENPDRPTDHKIDFCLPVDAQKADVFFRLPGKDFPPKPQRTMFDLKLHTSNAYGRPTVSIDSIPKNTYELEIKLFDDEGKLINTIYSPADPALIPDSPPGLIIWSCLP